MNKITTIFLNLPIKTLLLKKITQNLTTVVLNFDFKTI